MPTHYTHSAHTALMEDREVYINPCENRVVYFGECGPVREDHLRVYQDYNLRLSVALTFNWAAQQLAGLMKVNTDQVLLAVDLTPSQHSHHWPVWPLTPRNWPHSGWPRYWAAWTINQPSTDSSAAGGGALLAASYDDDDDHGTKMPWLSFHFLFHVIKVSSVWLNKYLSHFLIKNN